MGLRCDTLVTRLLYSQTSQQPKSSCRAPPPSRQKKEKSRPNANAGRAAPQALVPRVQHRSRAPAEVGVRRAVLARGELDKLEGSYKIRRKEGGVAPRRRKPREQGIGGLRRSRTRQRRATRQRMKRQEGENSRVGRPRGGMKVAARIGEGLRREIGRGRLPRE